MRTRPSVQLDEPVGEPLGLQTVVSHEHEGDAEIAAQVHRGWLRRWSRARSSRAEVGSSSRSTSRLECEGACQHHALLLADGEAARLAVAKPGRQGDVLEQGLHLDLPVEELRPVGDVLGDGSRNRRRELLHQHRPPPQLERVELADVPALEQHAALLGVGEAVQKRSSVDLPEPDGPQMQEEPAGSSASTSRRARKVTSSSREERHLSSSGERAALEAASAGRSAP